jgi:hypothetical protein
MSFMGWQKYLMVGQESTWGTAPGTINTYFPYTSYDLGVQVESNQADLFTGLRQRKHNRINKANVTGSLAMPFWSAASTIQTLVDAAVSSPAGTNLTSFTMDRFENGVDNKRHRGVRINTMEIAGDADSGIVTVNFGLVAKDETGGVSPASLSATAAMPVECSFSDVEFYLSSESEGESATGTGDALAIRSFRIAVNNNLQTYHTNSYFPTLIPAGIRSVDFQFSLFNTANTYDALRRTSTVTNRAANLVIKGPTSGSVKANIYFDRLNFSNAADSAALNELSSQSVDWIVLKPPTTENDIEFAWSTVS